LTPSQQAAREFWRQAGADGMPPFYIMSQYYAQLSANSDNLPAVTAALEQLLTGLAYATDVDTVLSEFTAGQDEELGYWAGRYGLFDSAGNRFDLVVGRDSATLTVPPALVDVQALPATTDLATVTVLNSTGFSQGVLSLTNAQCQASLRFTLPVSDTSFDAPEPAALFQAMAPQCTGTVVVVGGANAGTHSVTGKRGAWTQAGVAQAADGDPAAAWYGQYILLDVTDVTAVVQVADPVFIYDDPTYGLTFQWGASTYGSNVTYSNNVLRCADQDDDTTQYMMQFVAPQVGGAELNLAVSRAGVVRSYKGYWVDAYTAPTALTQGRQAPRRLTAEPGAGGSYTAGSGYSQAIDVSKLTAGDPPKINKIALLHGVVGNPYTLTLQLTGAAATDTFAWTLTPTGGSNDATGRAAIAPGSGANQSPLFSLDTLSSSDAGKHLLVTVQLKNTSATPQVTYTLQFDVLVGQYTAIYLAPKVLMPVVVGTAYTQNLVAHGANGTFNWSLDTSTALPPGLTWDPDNHQLSGTVTDANQVGKAFNFVVGLAAPDVIMDSQTVSLGITVQSAPVVASDTPSWQNILIIAVTSGVGMILLAALAIHRYRQAQEKKEKDKTDAAVKEGQDTVEKATNGDPKDVIKTVLKADKDKLSIVKDNIPNNQSLIDNLKQMQEDFYSKLKEIPDVDKMMKYIDDHEDANPDDPVDDEDLREAGYDTFGQIDSALDAYFDLRDRLSKSIAQSNDITVKNTSDQKFVNDQDASSNNDDKLNASLDE
jgi:hypothetical protein